MKDKISKMTKDEIIDFLINNWTELVNEMPKGKERMFFQNHSVEDMREMALSINDRNL